MRQAERIARTEETDRAAWASIGAEVATRDEKTARLRAARLEREKDSDWQPLTKAGLRGGKQLSQ
jgi:hypothetical protein